MQRLMKIANDMLTQHIVIAFSAADFWGFFNSPTLNVNALNRIMWSWPFHGFFDHGSAIHRKRNVDVMPRRMMKKACAWDYPDFARYPAKWRR